MLQFDPSKRISSANALKHSFLRENHDSDDEPDGEKFVDDFEKGAYSLEQLKEKIFQEMRTFRPPEQCEQC